MQFLFTLLYLITDMAIDCRQICEQTCKKDCCGMDLIKKTWL